MKPSLSFSLLAIVALFSACSQPPGGDSAGGKSFTEARAEFKTTLTKDESEDYPADIPPPINLQLVTYESDGRELDAYVSTDPGTGERHPAVIWLTGGFGNSISGLVWEPQPRTNDQSGAAFWKAGICTMYPSLRGGNQNEGSKEGLYGEVDDVLAAVEYLKEQPYIDPSQIYLGGHSTGGTLALLTAAASQDSFRAVLALGPVADTTVYGSENLPFDVNDETEQLMRAPVVWLKDIDAPTLISEGTEGGNLDSLEWMEKENANPLISFLPLEENDHFTVIAPTTEAFARQILAAQTDSKPFAFDVEAIRDEMAHLRLPPRSPFRTDEFHSDPVVFEFAIYLKNKTTRKDAMQIVDEVLESFPDLERSPEDDEPLGGYEVLPVFVEDVSDGYAPPDVASLQYMSIGLDKSGGEGLQKVEQAIRVFFRHPSEENHAGLKQANQFLVALETRLDGFLWDETTRQILTPEAWNEIRVESWTEEFPDVRQHITIHAYRNGDDIRSITLGMEKFGAPDVLFDRFPWSENRGVGNLMNTVAQLLIEGLTTDNPDSVPIALEAVTNESFRSSQLEGIAENGIGKALVAFKQGPREEGDPFNAILEIHPEHHDGPDMYAQQHALCTELFGATSQVKSVKHDDDALQEASARARAKLPELRKQFLAGYDPGQYLLVKAPFGDDEGREWMWVQVQEWGEEAAISGVLRSDPHFVEGLKAGQKVDVKTEDVFDYILNFPDGTMEGNETGEIIQQMSGKTAP